MKRYITIAHVLLQTLSYLHTKFHRICYIACIVLIILLLRNYFEPMWRIKGLLIEASRTYT